MTKIVPLFGIGQQGKSSTVTAQRHLNLFAEFVPDGDKTRMAFYGTPGDTLFTSFGDTPIRGVIVAGDFAYVVHRGILYEVNNAGTQTSRGTLNTTSGRVDMAYDGTRLVIVDGTNGYTYAVVSTTFTQISSGNFPNGANTVTWLDGQFIVDTGDSDSFYISADGTTWNALDFATAESAPDGLVRVFADHGEVMLFGTATTEFWGNIGGADFPFAPIKGSTAEIGLASRWSVAKFDSGVAFLGKNLQGQVQMYLTSGYSPKVISSQEIDALINGYSAVTDATVMSYVDRGHPMLVVNFPSAGKSWMFDASTRLWSPRESGLDGDRYHGEICFDYINKVRICDYADGTICNLDATVYTENGTEIAREIVGKHVMDGYDRIIVDELRVDFETGIGLVSGQGSDPQAMLLISKDNGHTWGAELWANLGAMGDYLAMVAWRRLGLSRDWLFKIRITDPIKVVITGAAMRMRKAVS